MKNVNAIIVNNDLLNKEIVFTKISDYIEHSLKSSGISNVFYTDSLTNVSKDALDNEYVIIINEIAPEIIEFDALYNEHTQKKSDITFFASNFHCHDNGIVLDENKKPCAFGCSEYLSKINVFMISSKDFINNNSIIENPFDSNVNFLEIDETNIIKTLSDVVNISCDFKETINFSHIDNGVYILDPANTYISSGVLIKKGTTILPGCIIKGNTSIGANCTIGPNTYITNSEVCDDVSIEASKVVDSKIGEKTTVGPFANLRPLTVLGKKVKIGDFVETKKCTIEDGSKVSHLSYIGDAHVGKDVNIGCGAVCVNYDGFDKFKTVIEDGAFIGCNTNLVAPVTIEKGAITAAGSTITKTVPEDALAIARAKQEHKPLWADKFRKLKSKK